MRNMICMLALCISLGSALTARAEGDLLHINYADSYPPLSYGQHDSVKGVLPELMDAILVQKMGYAVVNNGKAWKRAQEEVWNGRADLLITSATPERAQYSYQSRQPVFTLSFRPLPKLIHLHPRPCRLLLIFQHSRNLDFATFTAINGANGFTKSIILNFM